MENLNLRQICSIYNTDKNNYHSYVDEVYEDLFRDVRYSTKKLLEIGVDNGASLFMWRDYFSNAIITGIDSKVCPQAIGRERIESIVGDAYNYDTCDSLTKDFDIIIDDGPHTLESMTFVILEYTKKINHTGMIIIEDVQDFNWTNILKRHVPDNFDVNVRDLRKFRNRYDDILMIITPKSSHE